ncbi:SUR7 family protein pun1-like protein 1 [Botrytis cinerea]
MQPLAAIPLACSIVTFVLGMLCLFAGNKPGFMEDYHIVTLNTSGIGQDLIPTTTSGSGSTPTSLSPGGIVSSLSSLIPREPGIGDAIANALGDLENEIADKLAETLGIEEWYSLHLMDMCQGYYTPNATSKGAGFNVSSCTNQTAMCWPSAIQDGLDTLSTAMNATFVFYCIGVAGAGLAILTSLAAIFITGRIFSFLNWGLASIALLALAIASIIVTVLQNKAAHIINKFGNDIGVYAYKGQKYLILTWAATAVIAVATIAWVAIFCIGRRQKGREFHEKSHFGKKSRQSESSEFARRGA